MCPWSKVSINFHPLRLHLRPCCHSERSEESIPENRALAAAQQGLRQAGVRQINLMVYEDNDDGEQMCLIRGYGLSPVKMTRKRL